MLPSEPGPKDINKRTRICKKVLQLERWKEVNHSGARQASITSMHSDSPRDKNRFLTDDPIKTISRGEIPT